MCASIFQARAEVAPKWEVDTPRDDDLRRCPGGRDRGQGGRVRRVSVHDPRVAARDRASESQGGDGIELAVGRHLDDLEAPLGGTIREIFIRTRDQYAAMATVAHSLRQPQDLAFTAAPPALLIDVNDRQQ